MIQLGDLCSVPHMTPPFSPDHRDDEVLPLTPDVLIALLGPGADTLGAASVRAALEHRHGAGMVLYAEGCDAAKVDGRGFAHATYAAESADVAVVVLLDGPGGAAELQQELLEDVIATGTPVVVIVVATGQWDLGSTADRCAVVLKIPTLDTQTVAGLVDELTHPGHQPSTSQPGTIRGLGRAIFGETEPDSIIVDSGPSAA